MFTPTTVVKTDIGVLMASARDRLIDQEVVAANCCFLSIRPEQCLRYPPGDTFIVISPADGTVNEGVRIGAGRHEMLILQNFTITLWTRLALDRVPQEDGWLTDEALGAITTNNAIINAMELYIPFQDGNQLTHIGYRLGNIRHFERSENSSKHSEGNTNWTGETWSLGWGGLQTSWNIEYAQVLDETN